MSAELNDLLRDLGDIPLSRIRLHPFIGTATIEDVIRNDDCELIDGTLVERAGGLRESFLTCYLSYRLNDFVRPRNCGILIGARGLLEIRKGLVRSSPVAFLSWDRIPGRKVPDEPVPNLAPDLAVEVLCAGNTKREMARKRREYFAAGTRLVWMVDPVARTIAVYTAETEFRTLTEADELDGGAELPGFTVPVKQVFAELDRHG